MSVQAPALAIRNQVFQNRLASVVLIFNKCKNLVTTKLITGKLNNYRCWASVRINILFEINVALLDWGYNLFVVLVPIAVR